VWVRSVGVGGGPASNPPLVFATHSRRKS